MHKTKNLDDGYIGSGKLLRRAIKKYGLENFSTVILHIFDEEWKMKVAEKILVVLDKEISYNLCPGGKGGWGYINKNGLVDYKTSASKGGSSLRDRLSSNSSLKKKWTESIGIALRNKINTDTAYRSMHYAKLKVMNSRDRSGAKNPSYRKIWIKNMLSNENRRVSIDSLDLMLSDGWTIGMIKK
jgi:hypothetical protein